MKEDLEDFDVTHLPFHISARTNNREYFSLDLRSCWDLFADYLYGVRYIFDARIHAFVLMGNHYHMMASFPKSNRGDAMCWFQTQVAKNINFGSGKINHLWGGPYHGSLISNPRYYSMALRYIYRNPVAARLCSRPWDYPFSSLHGELGAGHLQIPLSPAKRWISTLVPRDAQAYLNYLDGELPEGFDEYYSTAWKRKELHFNTRMRRTLFLEGIDTSL